MIYLTQVIYLKPGQETIFDEFEAIALPAMSRYGGQLLLRIRPTREQILAGTLEPPYEVHLVSFENEQDVSAFLKDEERQRFLHLKDKAIQSTLLFKGDKF